MSAKLLNLLEELDRELSREPTLELDDTNAREARDTETRTIWIMVWENMVITS
jgi:hypothetical protein